MSLAVLTTVYPAVEPWLADFTASLARQDDGDFTLYVLNDGLAGAERHFAALDDRVRVVPLAGTISAIRRQGLERIAADGHELVVFADSDDHFSRERIAVVRAGLARHDVVANELVPFGAGVVDSAPLLRPLLTDGAAIGWRDLLDHNPLGLSNTAARVAAVLPHAARVAGHIEAFDWALFTRALHAGASAVFSDRAITHYRRHGASIGMIAERTPAALAHAVEVKALHYRELASLGPAFAERARTFSALEQGFAADRANLDRYATAIAALPPARGLWWSAARLP